ncbi:secretion-chaperone-like protein [Ranid herpesvirus 3]|uniref:Secretion-chaperone-like protein n=1 Tax=Ranid herpesvirus 3 TaxID=1987509 RepID=A0A1X9T5I2_9VIRU|nr:secretion-chaperone-like protein [Ranid herpesvirus 3]ARR28953.1 secretion-chaperone-like protein [Ranid herpesvirus 3]
METIKKAFLDVQRKYEVGGIKWSALAGETFLAKFGSTPSCEHYIDMLSRLDEQVGMWRIWLTIPDEAWCLIKGDTPFQIVDFGLPLTENSPDWVIKFMEDMDYAVIHLTQQIMYQDLLMALHALQGRKSWGLEEYEFIAIINRTMTEITTSYLQVSHFLKQWCCTVYESMVYWKQLEQIHERETAKGFKLAKVCEAEHNEGATIKYYDKPSAESVIDTNANKSLTNINSEENSISTEGEPISGLNSSPFLESKLDHADGIVEERLRLIPLKEMRRERRGALSEQGSTSNADYIEITDIATNNSNSLEHFTSI